MSTRLHHLIVTLNFPDEDRSPETFGPFATEAGRTAWVDSVEKIPGFDRVLFHLDTMPAPFAVCVCDGGDLIHHVQGTGECDHVGTLTFEEQASLDRLGAWSSLPLDEV